MDEVFKQPEIVKQCTPRMGRSRMPPLHGDYLEVVVRTRASALSGGEILISSAG